jgi:hypothetical protein
LWAYHSSQHPHNKEHTMKGKTSQGTKLTQLTKIQLTKVIGGAGPGNGKR